ncbi:TnsA endonuclease N-terminal domain-containing protein [Vibrio renipiscarius]|uniref:Endonuclease n=1 Tax=Vibrio renipiscarius TaxID=1461322 RepID=A0A0C2K3X7_9VIBR|nr:TnsA endonuclease N-terminal domain-containing protein [Vibrio renipiscarius]KII76613.1 endonuclease [Vibrio renipiscarius]KII77866.1 endonuclease [Vibrio renipiscarius]
MDRHLTSSQVVSDALESAFTTPARNLTKSRGKNIHRFASVKMGHRVSVESTLEFDACFHFDFVKSITRFCSQPIKYTYVLDGKKHKYVPDFLAEFDTGELILYEVKSDFEVSKSDFKREFEAKRLAAKRLGVELELIEESQIRVAPLLNNLKLIHRYASRSDLTEIQQLVLSIFRRFGSLNVNTLISKTGISKPYIMPIICDLLSKCLLDTNLEVPITADTTLELRYG